MPDTTLIVILTEILTEIRGWRTDAKTQHQTLMAAIDDLQASITQLTGTQLPAIQNSVNTLVTAYQQESPTEATLATFASAVSGVNTALGNVVSQINTALAPPTPTPPPAPTPPSSARR